MPRSSRRPYGPHMSEGHGSGLQALTREQVTALLEHVHTHVVEDLEPLAGGWWSAAWGYRLNGEELVVRVGRDATWYETDRMAMAFAGPDLPVPEVRGVGVAPDGHAYAISVRHHGVFLEDTSVDRAEALAASLTRLLVALYDVPGDDLIIWHSPGAPRCSWRQFLMAGLVDDPDKLVHGWSATLASDPKLAVLASGVVERIQVLSDAIPERRDLVHGDLLHSNVLLSRDARRIEAVFSWKCSVRGDFLFDVAWCTFWAPWHPGIAAIDPLVGVLSTPQVRDDTAALVDAAVRHHLYELQIGFTHLGWNIWSGNQVDLEATAEQLRFILDRGPLTLPKDLGNAEVAGAGPKVMALRPDQSGTRGSMPTQA
jgi:aminoglycoside phosphotransferase (APT) family kinase protein